MKKLLNMKELLKRFLAKAIKNQAINGRQKSSKTFVRLALGVFLAGGLLVLLTITILYNHAFRKTEAQLETIVHIHVELLETSAHLASDDIYDEFKGSKLFDIVKHHLQSENFGDSGELVVAWKEDNDIMYLIGSAHTLQGQQGSSEVLKYAINSSEAEPMQQALLGKTGTMIGRDYRGEIVLAAYQPVEILNFGLVAKIDIAEIRAPFIIAAINGGVVVLLASVLCPFFLLKLHQDVVRSLEELIEQHSGELEKINQKLQDEIITRKSAENILRETLEFNETIFSSSLEGMLAYRSSGHCVLVNEAAVTAIGGSREQLLNQNFWNISSWKKYGLLSIAKEILHNGGNKVLELYMTSSFGKSAWFEFRFSRFIVGGEANLLVMLNDISGRKAVEDALIQARKNAEVANKAKSAFLATMSHELRTPLNAILGFAQIMARQKRRSADEQENINIIMRNGKHLLNLINDVLEISKIEAGKLVLNEEIFNLPHLLEDLREQFSVTAQSKGISLTLEYSQDLPAYVKLDIGKLKQILINLLSNAIKFTSVGKVTLKAESSPSVSLNGIVLNFAIEDTGHGITEPEMQQLFKPFVQTESGLLSHKGTGLGLAISYQFVQLMGGKLEASSRPGRGTIFHFAIETSVVPQEPAPQPKRRIFKIARSQPGNPRFRILAVDDNQDALYLLEKMLKPLDFDFKTAANGKEALKVSQDWQPHLILMDLRMPVLDGYKATRLIKSTPQGKHIVVIAITASAFEEERSRVFDSGCQGFIRKPFQEEQLLEVLEEHLGLSFITEEVDVNINQQSLTNEKALFDTQLSSFASNVASLPHELIHSLKQATKKGDFKRLQVLADEVATQDAALGKTLQELINNFDYTQISELIQQAPSQS